MLGVNDLFVARVDRVKFEMNLKSLNNEQHDVFDKVIQTVEHSELHRLKMCDCQKLKELRLFTSGVASMNKKIIIHYEFIKKITISYFILGTGKSFLIDAICQKIKVLYQKENIDQGWLVAVLAPTGLAAFNVNGLTIHRFFKLPVFNDTGDQHWPLSDGNLKLIRALQPNLKLLIIGKKINNMIV